MKNQIFSLLALAATTSLVAASADLPKKDPDPAVIAPAPVTTPTVIAPAPAAPTTVAVVATSTADPFADIAAALDNTTKATTSNLAAPQAALNKTLDAQISASSVSGPTNTAMASEKLALARTDFAQKLRDLSLQGDETWKNAKAAAQISLQNLRRVYAEYLAGPEKN